MAVPKELSAVFEVEEEAEDSNIEVKRTYSVAFDESELTLVRQDVYTLGFEEDPDREGHVRCEESCSFSIQDLDSLTEIAKGGVANLLTLLDQSAEFSQPEWNYWLNQLAPLACKGVLYQSSVASGIELRSMTGTWENFEHQSSKHLLFDGYNLEFETENRIVDYTLDEYDFDCSTVSLKTFEELNDQLQVTDSRVIFRTIGDGWTWNLIEELFSAKGTRD